MPNNLAVFEGHKIRRSYDEKAEKWYFSIVDVIQVLIQQPDFQAARNYWKVLKNRLRKEGSESVTKCNRLKLPAADGKSYLADVADAETLLRLVQSVPSPKAEPIKLWLAKVGYERMQEMSDPSLSLNRARETWKKHGRSDKWIESRMTGQETRNKLTDYWAKHEIKKGGEYAVLTNIIHQEWAGVTVQAHKNLKGLKTQNLRDHMTEAELIFTALAELSTRQIAWKLFHSRWNLSREPSRRPRILYLADRNILADQAYNAFSAFPEDAMVRIAPEDIRKKGKVPKNGSVFFTIFQTFMSGPPKEGKPSPYFGEYPPDFFDFIVIDECHRGGANDESNWRGILEYFAPAVQLGLTATPKRKDNVDTYAYFGEPVYIYSLKEGINDGFLTPFKVKQISTTLDEYVYTPDDQLIEGEVEAGKRYTEGDFNRIIEIKEREAHRVKLFMGMIDQREKTLVFCATQDHALAVRDLINQMKASKDPNYCARVTANDGEIGEQHLRDFQDNEKNIPTILTTSQKLSTGVDARNVRNIVLMRPINSMIEFKQIIGRGTRLYDGKDYFTIYDFVNAHHHFNDPEWDGEPVDNTKDWTIKTGKDIGREPVDAADAPDTREPRKKVRIKLANGKERTIQHMVATTFWSSNGKPMSAAQFLQSLFGALPEFFHNEAELRALWSSPDTRKGLLAGLAEKGFGKDQLIAMQEIIDAENSDLYDVLAYVAFELTPISREERASGARAEIGAHFGGKQREFLDFVLSQYVQVGVDELDQEKLSPLLKLKYNNAIADAVAELGQPEQIQQAFVGFQKYLYAQHSA